MNVLLVFTVGQTDVQLVVDGQRTEFAKRQCAQLHAELERRDRDWRVVDVPTIKRGEIDTLPREAFALCTPKLDAVLDYLDGEGMRVTHTLIFDTQRDPQTLPSDPRAAGLVIHRRLCDRLGESLNVERVTLLENNDRLEDRSDPRDAVLRRDVVVRLDQAIRSATTKLNGSGHIIVASTGGIPQIAALTEDVVRLHAGACMSVRLIEVPDGAKANPPTGDYAVARNAVPEPTESFRVRRHALDLIDGGNLLGAWGAVRHLHCDEVECRWTRVVEWLSLFAASLPIPDGCDIAVLRHPKMAVRAAVRVELALLAGDVPRAVHGTVAFFEAALWDWLHQRDFRCEDDATGSPARGFTFPAAPTGEKGTRFKKRKNELLWRVNDFKAGIDAWLTVLAKPKLTALWDALSDEIRDLRNDVAHNEPTPELMEDARRRMEAVDLWSKDNTFLTQSLVQEVLRELGVEHPERLCDELITDVRNRLLAHVSA